jgi:hypothetical protein
MNKSHFIPLIGQIITIMLIYHKKFLNYIKDKDLIYLKKQYEAGPHIANKL